MQTLHPALLEFRTELERQGYVAVCHSDHICVRLPLVASVRIRLNGGQLHVEPRFGPFARGTSLVLTPIIAALAVVGVSTVAPVATTVVMAFAGILTVLYDTQRLIMTEGATTRLQMLWSTRQPPADVIEGAAKGIGAGAGTAALGEGAAVAPGGTSVAGTASLKADAVTRVR